MDYKHRFNLVTVILSAISCILLWIVVILNIVAFATDYWFTSDGYSPFVHIGFFHACFDQCGRPYCPVGDDDMVLDKCFSLWAWFQDDYYIREHWDWLTPDWFQLSRALVIVIIPLSIINAFILSLVAAMLAADGVKAEPDKKKDRFMQVTLFVTAGINLLAGLLSIVAVCVFYTNAYRRDWMPMPYKNHLDYSFWLEVSCACLLMLSFLGCLFAAIFKTNTILEGEDEDKFTDEGTLSTW